MFAFFFDEDHSDVATIFGPQFASKIVVPIEKMEPTPKTRLLTGSLLHNMLVYDVESVVIGGHDDTVNSDQIGTFERAQNSVPNYKKRRLILCDLAETLSKVKSSFGEEEILDHLARKNIWVIVAPTLSEKQTEAVHKSVGSFYPYLGYAFVDIGNPLHRQLFLESLYNNKAIGPGGLAFRRDFFDDDPDELTAFADEYGSQKAVESYDSDEFDARFPPVLLPSNNSKRGDLTAKRLAGNDPGHRSRVARELMDFDGDGTASPFSFSARRPDDAIEFRLPEAKFTEYLLNKNHPDGASKANFFYDTLGIVVDDWRYLADQILQGAKKASLYRLKLSDYGVGHGALVLVTGRNGRTAVLETGWRVPAEGPALFVTAYPADERRSEGLSPNSVRVPLPNLVGAARWEVIEELAHDAGMLAAERAVPTPMVLEEFGTEWEGECGFGWVQLPDGRSSFARWTVTQGRGHRGHPGVRLYSRAMTQSVVKNRAYAEAFGEVLRSNGIVCAIGSRLD